ncbi:hypothetical protein ACVAMH_23270 [Bacillus zanthoxyli]
MKLKNFLKNAAKFLGKVTGGLGLVALVLSGMKNTVEEMTKLLLAMKECVAAMKEFLNVL